jgi:hypothetical protein
MQSTVSKVPGESILLITLSKSITEPDSQTENYALANRLSQMLRQSSRVSCVIDAQHVDIGSVERIITLIDSLSGAACPRIVLVLSKYASATLRAAVPAFSSIPRAMDEARRAA